MVKKILHLEGFAVLIASLFCYQYLIHGDWWLFVLLLLTPDLSMIGYLKNKRLGAIIYNLGHTYLLAIALLLIGFSSGNQIVLELCFILFAHIGMDRMLGFGLKYKTNFKDTHLQKI